MTTRSTIKDLITFSILSIIGAIFVFKYGARIIFDKDALFLIIAIYIIVYISSAIFLRNFDTSKYSWLNNQFLLFAVFGNLVFTALIIVTITSDVSRVSRYSAMIE